MVGGTDRARVERGWERDLATRPSSAPPFFSGRAPTILNRSCRGTYGRPAGGKPVGGPGLGPGGAHRADGGATSAVNDHAPRTAPAALRISPRAAQGDAPW